MIRFLHPTEYPLISPILAENGTTAPDPNHSRITIAQDQVGGLLGFSILQPVLHLEPVWTTISERGSSLWEELMRAQLNRLTEDGVRNEIYAFAPRPAIEKLLESRLGFERLDWRVMRKQIEGR